MLNLNLQIENIENELKKDEHQPYFSKEKDKYISFSEYITEIENQKNELMFNIRESTGEGNYKEVANWTSNEVHEYIRLKSKQLRLLKNKNKVNE